MKKLGTSISVFFVISLALTIQEVEYNVLVAQDESGNYTTITDAVNAAPKNNIETYIIKIKSGNYTELVRVGSEKVNLKFVGEGMTKTIISWNRSYGDGWSTYKTATAAIEGDGFTAIDITFENTAFPEKGQAVALLSRSNFSAFYRCKFSGHQDTLYVYKGYQFYKECEIYGTTDFIFGDAVVVLQNCDIYAIQPQAGHTTLTITAQGRDDETSQTGIILHNCSIIPSSDFTSRDKTRTYLGRPWRKYSTTVIMQSFMSDIIDPEGWLAWNNDSTRDNTLFYAEYENWGPGANTSQRVHWKGYKVIESSNEASNFTVRNFIRGDTWIPSRGIPFISDLVSSCSLNINPKFVGLCCFLFLLFLCTNFY